MGHVMQRLYNIRRRLGGSGTQNLTNRDSGPAPLSTAARSRCLIAGCTMLDVDEVTWDSRGDMG